MEKINGSVVLSIIIAAVVLTLLLGFPVKWLWNWLIPDLFGLKTIDFWQAWGLMMLIHLLFPKSVIQHLPKLGA